MVAKRTDLGGLPFWPRGLSREQASAYCGISSTLFDQECPVQPIRIASRVLYLRDHLDRWLDDLANQRDDKNPWDEDMVSDAISEAFKPRPKPLTARERWAQPSKAFRKPKA